MIIDLAPDQSQTTAISRHKLRIINLQILNRDRYNQSILILNRPLLWSMLQSSIKLPLVPLLGSRDVSRKSRDMTRWFVTMAGHRKLNLSRARTNKFY